MKPFLPALACLSLLFLTSCGGSHFGHDVATRIASPSFMIKRVIPAGPFALTAYERMHKRHAPATVYIEGDGPDQGDPIWTAFGGKPSPSNPVALHLASRDLSKNLVWLARPCQYSGMREPGEDCPETYWNERKFSPEVLAAYNEALNNIKRRYDIENFHLVGFGGGGAIAALLGAQRADILSLRTVAGTLDHEVAALLRDQTPPTASLNPVAKTARLAGMPQIHYVGGQDHVTRPAVLESYLQAIGPISTCVQYRFIQTASHDAGWVGHWPELLEEKPRCGRQTPQTDFAPLPYEPVRIQREPAGKK